MRLDFGEQARIHDVIQVGRRPLNPKVRVTPREVHSVEFAPIDLNPGDRVWVRVLVSGSSGITPNAHIAGVTRVRPTHVRYGALEALFLVGVTMAIVGWIGIQVLASQDLPPYPDIAHVPLWMWAIVLAFLAGLVAAALACPLAGMLVILNAGLRMWGVKKWLHETFRARGW